MTPYYYTLQFTSNCRLLYIRRRSTEGVVVAFCVCGWKGLYKCNDYPFYITACVIPVFFKEAFNDPHKRCPDITVLAWKYQTTLIIGWSPPIPLFQHLVLEKILWRCNTLLRCWWWESFPELVFIQREESPYPWSTFSCQSERRQLTRLTFGFLAAWLADWSILKMLNEISKLPFASWFHWKTIIIIMWCIQAGWGVNQHGCWWTSGTFYRSKNEPSLKLSSRSGPARFTGDEHRNAEHRC